MNYPSLNDQLKVFPVYTLFKGELNRIGIKSITEYSHWCIEAHHYVKEQEYYKNPAKYYPLQKFILLPKGLHRDLHSGMSDKRFYDKWKINKSMLLHRNRILEGLENG